MNHLRILFINGHSWLGYRIGGRIIRVRYLGRA